MVVSDHVRELFSDSRTLYDDALEMLAQDRIRNAAEKAWGATKRATDALALARTGEEPPTTAMTTEALLTLVGRDNHFEPLVGRYFTRISYLHGSCFYDGMCNPETERRIRETIDYIRDAENLAAIT